MTKRQTHKDTLKALDDYQVALAIKGDPYAFNLLYKRWHPKLLRFAYRLTRNKDDAQDVTQDAAITIAKNIGKLQDPTKFSAWAYTIIRRRAADHIANAIKARKARKQTMEFDGNQYSNDMDGKLSMKQALSQLAESDRILLSLFYIDGMTGSEMATALGIPLGTVKSRLFTARSKLYEIYTRKK